MWFIFWLILGFDSPATHPRISQSEREYIETSIAAAKLEENEDKVREICKIVESSGLLELYHQSHY